jgi:hypothetical protein
MRTKRRQVRKRLSVRKRIRSNAQRSGLVPNLIIGELSSHR